MTTMILKIPSALTRTYDPVSGFEGLRGGRLEGLMVLGVQSFRISGPGPLDFGGVSVFLH